MEWPLLKAAYLAIALTCIATGVALTLRSRRVVRMRVVFFSPEDMFYQRLYESLISDAEQKASALASKEE